VDLTADNAQIVKVSALSVFKDLEYLMGIAYNALIKYVPVP